jgi:hypothetical protein
MTKKLLLWEYSVLVFVILAALAVFVKTKNTDMDFCRSVFGGLAQGRFSADRMIDWQNLKALDQDIGADYRGLPNDAERLAFRRAFIRSFSTAFRGQGARARDFRDWRVYSREGQKVTVAADQIGKNKEIIKTILFTVSLYPQRKLISLQGYVAAGKK